MSINDELCGCGPILCARLLRKVDEKLIDLLRSFTASEWEQQTIAPMWKVRDVVAHLLDTALRKLSLARDSCFVEDANLRSLQDVVSLVNHLNQEGVTIYRRLSPTVLIELMAMACEQSASFHESLAPFAHATFGVSWAGEERSLNWFDTARELTERWHHQQQIRLATGRSDIMIPELYHPVLDCFVRGLPYAYRHTTAPNGTIIFLEISGECGGKWALSKESDGWRFVKRTPERLACKVILPQAIAWRVFTKGIDPSSARAQIEVEGDLDLADGILGLVAIVG